MDPFAASGLHSARISHTYPVRIRTYLGTTELQNLSKIPEQCVINRSTSLLYYQRAKLRRLLWLITPFHVIIPLFTLRTVLDICCSGLAISIDRAINIETTAIRVGVVAIFGADESAWEVSSVAGKGGRFLCSEE